MSSWRDQVLKEFTPKVARLTLVADPDGLLLEEGMLEGIGRGLCRLKYLPVDTDIKLGDQIISAGLGGVYPKGLVVGFVESVRLERGGIYKSCIVKPAVSLRSLEEVLCLELDSKP